MARVRRQAAVIPYRIRKARRSGAGDDVPGQGVDRAEGSVDAGERPRDAAIREAEEEAGLRGVVARKPLGRYRHVKGNGPCRVDVYLMRVTNVLEHWLEDKSGAAAGCASPMRRTVCAKSCSGSFTVSRPSDSTPERGHRCVSHEPSHANRCTSSRGDASPMQSREACRALLPTRHHPIARHRFTVLDTFDGRVRRAARV